MERMQVGRPARTFRNNLRLVNKPKVSFSTVRRQLQNKALFPLIPGLSHRRAEEPLKAFNDTDDIVRCYGSWLSNQKPETRVLYPCLSVQLMCSTPLPFSCAAPVSLHCVPAGGGH